MECGDAISPLISWSDLTAIRTIKFFQIILSSTTSLCQVQQFWWAFGTGDGSSGACDGGIPRIWNEASVRHRGSLRREWLHSIHFARPASCKQQRKIRHYQSEDDIFDISILAFYYYKLFQNFHKWDLLSPVIIF